MTAGARRVWDGYTEQLAGSLRVVDGYALSRLCEDVAMLNELQRGVRKLARSSDEPAPGGAMTRMVSTPEGRRVIATINALASRIQRQEAQFGLTPASAGRLGDEAAPGSVPMRPMERDGIEEALCR